MAAQFSISELLIAREALAISVSPVLQKRSKPAPEPIESMVICPCTMGTLGKIAGGISDDLICRAADVMLKEKRTLILAPREMPFSAIHLENMLKLSHAGAVIMPPNPGFYHHPQSVQAMVDFVVARILDHLGVEQNLIAKWGE